MNDDVISDLKQFISAAVSQQTTEVRHDIERLDIKIDKVEKNLEVKINKVEKKIDDLAEFVSESFDAINEDTDKILSNHEMRIKKLETAKS